MSIEFNCGECGTRYRVEERFAGKSAPCRQCGAAMVVPRAPPPVPIADAAGDLESPAAQVPQSLTAAEVACLQCGVASPPGTLFCWSCGRALPSESPSGPRLISPLDAPATDIARNLVSDHLNLEMNKACWALLAVAMAQTFLGPVLIAKRIADLRADNPNIIYYVKPAGYLVIFAIAAGFWILFGWALKNPLPAAIVGLAFYVTLLVVDAVTDPSTIVQGWLVKMVLIALLIQAIQSGVRSRMLSRASAEAP